MAGRPWGWQRRSRSVSQDRSVDLRLANTPLLAKQYGEEIGTRAAPTERLVFTLAAYNFRQQSETTIEPDVDQALPARRAIRYGFEINSTYQIRIWLEF
jgi:hypothetical protein